MALRSRFFEGSTGGSTIRAEAASATTLSLVVKPNGLATGSEWARLDSNQGPTD